MSSISVFTPSVLGAGADRDKYLENSCKDYLLARFFPLCREGGYPLIVIYLIDAIIGRKEFQEPPFII
jgi:hypothetical protein